MIRVELWKGCKIYLKVLDFTKMPKFFGWVVGSWGCKWVLGFSIVFSVFS
jgi:hypothetical protein